MHPDPELINAIAEAEWTMFTSVNSHTQNAPSQEEKAAFTGTRRAQFEAWSEEAVTAYWNDIRRAKAENRNLVLEKYIFMMKSTMPCHYQQAAHLVTEPTGEKRDLVEELTRRLVDQTVSLFAAYPYVAGTGRPVHSSEDDAQNTSIETYQRGELSTYSTETLRALLEHLNALEAEDVLLSKQILENTVKCSGYDSLESAEAATAKRMQSGIQIGYKRCPACS